MNKAKNGRCGAVNQDGSFPLGVVLQPLQKQESKRVPFACGPSLHASPQRQRDAIQLIRRELRHNIAIIYNT